MDTCSLLRRDVDVLVQLEADDDLRHALGRDRPQLVDAADGVDRFFDLLRDLGLISCGDAPGSIVTTATMGRSTLGKRSTLRFL
jgi:hypothetical protein